jgi:hypothetical protein
MTVSIDLRWVEELKKLPAYRAATNNSDSRDGFFHPLGTTLLMLLISHKENTPEHLREERDRSRKTEREISTALVVLERDLQIHHSSRGALEEPGDKKLISALKTVIADLKRRQEHLPSHTLIGQKLNATAYAIRVIARYVPRSLKNRSAVIAKLLAYIKIQVDRRLVTSVLKQDDTRSKHG